MSRRQWWAGAFLAPALLLLGALVVYPIVYTVVRSLHDRAGDGFVGLRNYRDMLNAPATRTAIRNSTVWVVVAPTIVTALGLIFAVLTERVPWSTAFKIVIFMPMAISFLAAGVIFRLAYEADPDKGLANALARSTVALVRPPGQYPGARPSPATPLQPSGPGFVSTQTFRTGEPALLGLVAIAPRLVPATAEPAVAPAPGPGVSGIVWLDFSPTEGAKAGVVDRGERGLPGVTVQAVAAGRVAGEDTTDAAGRFSLDRLPPGEYSLRLTEAAFRPPFGGIDWLGPSLVTPSVIGAYLWIWTGFAMVVIAAGLAAIPRELLEAARVDGGGEWQVFRRVTVPLLRPVLLVVLVTLVINVLKVFDLVLVIPPGSSQDDANVIALEMWRASFGARDHGLGSALAVLLFILVVPAMAFNIRRFRTER